MADGFIPLTAATPACSPTARRKSSTTPPTSLSKGHRAPDPRSAPTSSIGLIKGGQLPPRSADPPLGKGLRPEWRLRERMTRARLRERDKQRRRPEGYWRSIAAAFRLCGGGVAVALAFVGADCYGAHREEGHHGSRP